jgi:hypothetical protein
MLSFVSLAASIAAERANEFQRMQINFSEPTQIRSAARVDGKCHMEGTRN